MIGYVLVPVDPTEAMLAAAATSDWLYKDDVASTIWSAMLTAAPVREEGGAGPGGYLVKDFADGWYWTPNAALDHAGGAPVWSVADSRYETEPPALATREEAPELALEDAKVFGVGFIVDGQRVSPDRVTVCRGEEAPAEAGESSLVDWFSRFVEDHQEGCGPDTDALIACLDRVRDSYRAQPQAREEEQPVADAVEPIERAIAALKGHVSAIQVGKQDGGSSSLITDCINGLPEIVRWIESGLFNVDAAFEQYEDTPPAPEAEKLRVAVEALEKASRAISAQYALAQAEYQHLDTVASKHDKIVQEGRRAIREALAALQQEGGPDA